jgi:mono/diheme cytochrome c family protein
LSHIVLDPNRRKCLGRSSIILIKGYQLIYLKTAAAIFVGTVLCLLMAAWLFAVPTTTSLTRPESPLNADGATDGVAAFQGAAFGGLSVHALNSHALPWRLTAAALVLEERRRDPAAELSRRTLNVILARFGFLIETDLVNGVPADGKDGFGAVPFGMTAGFIAPVGGSKLLVSNVGCAACHAGVTYDANGAPRPDRAWLGMPNTSINLEAYVDAIFQAMRNQTSNPSALIETASAIFPEMDWREKTTARWLILPQIVDRLNALKQQDRALPFPNGVPGATNGVAALKHVFGLPLISDGAGDNGIVSIPELGGRVWRSSLLADGAYAPKGRERQYSLQRDKIDQRHLHAMADITTFFTVPSMGVHPDSAKKYRTDARAIFAFLAEEYQPQSFPGAIDVNQARRGFAAYQRICAECHGTYGWSGETPALREFPNWLGTVGTDALRSAAFTPALAAAIEDTTYADTISAEVTGLYTAPPLHGLWASAPYLHNGSVPTIAALLSPDQRHESFLVGGHSLDFERLGLRLERSGNYPRDHVPFSTPVLYDTGNEGQRNGGHNFGTSLESDEKLDLLEFLKLL